MREPHPDITPYPYFIIDGAGACFAAGAIGGSVYHFIKGLYNSPNGRRIAAGAQAARINAPLLGGRLAFYCVVVEAFRYATISARKKDDIWSFVLPGLAAGICVPVGRGPRAIGISAIGGLCAATTVFGTSFYVRHIGYPGARPSENPGVIPPSVVDSNPSGSVRDGDLRCAQHI
jgi:import inner membrane translocase subunit TIM17